MYSFRGQIALPVERAARSVLNIDDHDFRETFVSADRISLGSFIEVMLFVLRVSRGYEADLDDFAKQAQPYLGRAGQDIPEADAKKLLEQFLSALGTSI